MEDKANRKFIVENVNPILEKMLIDILISKPPNVISFMKKWLDEKGGEFEGGLTKQNTKKKNESDSESDEDEDDEEVFDLAPKAQIAEQKQFKPGRVSVSAEAYGRFNKKGTFKAKTIPKSEGQKARIKQRLCTSFMFSSLDEQEQKIVIDAMQEKKFSKDNVVIKQGDQGDEVFVVDSGKLSCYKKFSKDGEDKYLKTYGPGEAFGELALLYNAPRAATIKADNESVLFSLDRETFNNIVKDAAMRKRDKYETFLSKIELLSTLDPYERSKLADCLKPMTFDAEEYIVKEGDTGDTFFFIESGDVIATKKKEGGYEETVYRYKPGDYFGELALLRDTPRAASILAKSKVSVVAVDRLSFKRLLGPLEEILKRNVSRYQQFVL